MPRDTILFNINKTVLDLSSLKPKFKAAFGMKVLPQPDFQCFLHTLTVCILTGIKSNFADLAGIMLDTIAARTGVGLPEVKRADILSGFASLPPPCGYKTGAKPTAICRLSYGGLLKFIAQSDNNPDQKCRLNRLF